MDMNAPIGAALVLDRKALFAALRKKGSTAFGKALTPSQVQVTEAIIDEVLRRQRPRNMRQHRAAGRTGRSLPAARRS